MRGNRGKVEIYILHWHDLSISAAGRTALNSKNGAKGRLTEGYHCSLPIFLRPSPKPTVVVVLPSPAAVG